MTAYLLDDNTAFHSFFAQAFAKEMSLLETEAAIYTCETADEMEALLPYHAPDICFFDIELTQGSGDGLAVAESIRKRYPNCQIIFLTNYLQYVTSAFDVQPVYYILKTELTQRLPAALALALRRLARQKDAKLEIIVQHQSVIIPQSSIVYLEHKQRITTVYCAGEAYETREVLSRLLPKLDQSRFFQCHYSFIINLHHVRAISGRFFLMKGGVEIPISRACYAEAKAVFSSFLIEETRVECLF